MKLRLIKYGFFLLGFLCILDAQGQSVKQQKLDSLLKKWQKDSAYMYRDKKWKLMAALDNRSSFVHTGHKVSVDIGGLQAGLVYKERHTFGIGGYKIVSGTGQTITDENNKIQHVTMEIGYGTLFYQYNFLNTKRWEMSVPLEIGTGHYKQSVKDSTGKAVPGFSDTLSKSITLFGAGYMVSFKIFKWLGVGAMVGYRLVGGGEPKKINLNGFVYSYGIEVYFGQIYKMAKFSLKRRSYRNNVKKIQQLPD